MKIQEPRYFLLVAGRGSLPGLVYNELVSSGNKVEVILLPGSDNQDLKPEYTEITPRNFFQILQSNWEGGTRHVVLAGAVDRPKQATISFQKGEITEQLSLSGGDDSILTKFLKVIEEIGFRIWGVQEIIPHLVDHEGVLTNQIPTSADKSDTRMAEKIVTILGEADIGQGVVVRNNQCIAVETIGTDWMLDSIGEIYSTFSNSPEERSGVLIKASKTNQDQRVDLPTIGPQTVKKVIAIGMGGLVIESGKVIIIDMPKVIELANQGGIFIWSKSINRNL